jgi:leucyl aminopeptidase
MRTQDISERLEAVRTDVLVLFHVEDEPAPRGRLGRVDWILLGAVSRLRARGSFTGEWGTTVLLSPGPKLKAERVLVMGVGRRADCSLTHLYRLSYQTAQTVLNLGCSQIALDLPFRVFSHEPPERVHRAFLEGFAAELQRGRPDVEFSVSTLSPTEPQ